MACSVWPAVPLIILYYKNRFIQIWNVLKLVAVIIHVCMSDNIPIPMVQHKVPFQCLHDVGITPAIIHTIIDYLQCMLPSYCKTRTLGIRSIIAGPVWGEPELIMSLGEFLLVAATQKL